MPQSPRVLPRREPSPESARRSWKRRAASSENGAVGLCGEEGGRRGTPAPPSEVVAGVHGRLGELVVRGLGFMAMVERLEPLARDTGLVQAALEIGAAHLTHAHPTRLHRAPPPLRPTSWRRLEVQRGTVQASYLWNLLSCGSKFGAQTENV